MSPARRHLQKTLNRLAQKAAADRAAKDAELAKPGRSPSPPPSDDNVAPTPRPGRATAAARYRQRLALRHSAEAANDNVAEPDDAALAGPYGQQLLQLVEHKRQLKALQSTEKKIALKREIISLYDDWIASVLRTAEETGKAVQDEVVITLMIWRIDVGDFMGGLEIAEHALKFGLAAPKGFERTVACLVAEQIAEAALAAPDDAPMPHGVLDLTMNLVDGQDMPDQVMAKLCKALGLELRRMADAPPDGHDIAGWRKRHLDLSYRYLARALKLHDKVGVKKELEVLARELKKEQADGSQ